MLSGITGLLSPMQRRELIQRTRETLYDETRLLINEDSLPADRMLAAFNKIDNPRNISHCAEETANAGDQVSIDKCIVPFRALRNGLSQNQVHRGQFEDTLLHSILLNKNPLERLIHYRGSGADPMFTKEHLTKSYGEYVAERDLAFTELIQNLFIPQMKVLLLEDPYIDSSPFKRMLAAFKKTANPHHIQHCAKETANAGNPKSIADCMAPFRQLRTNKTPEFRGLFTDRALHAILLKEKTIDRLVHYLGTGTDALLTPQHLTQIYTEYQDEREAAFKEFVHKLYQSQNQRGI